MKMDVWIEGRAQPVGVLTRADDKTLSFVYAKGADKGGRISLSLPVRSEPYGDADCRGYFANLLFEGPQLDSVLSSFKVDRDDYGTLLFHLGATAREPSRLPRKERVQARCLAGSPTTTNCSTVGASKRSCCRCT